MAGKKKYYQVLGLSPGATDEEVRKAYHRLAMEYHPDRNSDPAAGERFKEIREAYAILSGKEKPPRIPDSRHGTPYGYSWADDVARAWNDMAAEGHNNMYR